MKKVDLLLLLSNVLLFIFFLGLDFSKDNGFLVFAQMNIPTQFSTYTNEDYGIEIEYPSNWQQYGDVAAGDYIQHIAIFVPEEEIKFKKFDSTKDFYKMNTRVVIFLDYSYLLPKLNLNLVLDDAINTYSENTEGFKEFELFESDSNSKLSDRPAYKMIFQYKHNSDYIKYIELGTIINDNQVLSLNLKAKADEFDLLLPTFQRMIDSFKIGEDINDNDIDATDESRSVINSKNNEDVIKKIFEDDEN